MNMKKTMAAVSAAAVAISAMATTVSAEDTATTAAPAAGSISYDLVRETKTREDGTATYTITATGLTLDGASYLSMKLSNRFLSWKDSEFAITVKSGETNKVWQETYSPNVEKANYSAFVSYDAGTGVDGYNGVTIKIPVAPSLSAGISTNVYGDSDVAVTIVVTTKHKIKDDAQKFLNYTTDDVTSGALINKGDAIAQVADNYSAYSAANLYSDLDQDALIQVLDATSTVLPTTTSTVGVDTTATGGATAAVNIANYNTALANVKTAKATLDLVPGATTYTTKQAVADVITAMSLAGWATDVTVLGAADATYTTAFALTAGTDTRADAYTAAQTLYTAYGTYQGVVDTATAFVTDKKVLTLTYATFAAAPAKFTAAANAGEKIHLWPMLTTLNGVAAPTTGAYTKSNSAYSSSSAYINGWDLVDYLELNDDGLTNLGHIGKVGYRNVLPVLNDILANNSNVTFSFKTSALYVNTTVAESNSEYGEGKTEKKDNYWYNPTFGQHLYDNGFYGKEATGYVGTGSAWAFNLFTGGLVVNNNTTMALNDTAVFDWGESTLSFDWEDVAGGKVTNASEILYLMNLYTSTNWFWDTFTVTYSNEATEDVDTTAGTTGDEEVVEDVVETEAPVEDVVTDETEAPVEDTAANPTTGNASVALAVIPVALAAAAIVAKKRG